MSRILKTNTAQSITLGTPSHVKVAPVQVRHHARISATASHQPPKAKEDAKNPVPVTGFADKLVSDERIARLGVEKRVTPKGGRFLAQPEVVIGNDDRTRVGNPTAWPYCVQGHMIMKFPNGSVYIGTGTMVSRHHVLTAGHCVYSAADGGWATSIQFNAGQNDASLPFGSAWATRLVSVTGWTQNGDTNWDYGMLILDRELGDQTGWFGLITFPSDDGLSRKRVNVTGYPGDKGGQELWTNDNVIKAVADEKFFYDIDTMGGESGSGVWSLFDGIEGEKVAGVHTTGESSGNSATRISRPKFDNIVSWFGQW